MEQKNNPGSCIVTTQSVHDNGVAINAGIYNNIIFEDPFKYYSEKKIKTTPEIEKNLKLIELIIHKDILKQRFLGVNSKYDELINSVELYVDEKFDFNYCLDDGYKSIISSIIKVSSYFKLMYNHEVYFGINGNDNLRAMITTNGIEISYSNDIETFEKYKEAEKYANKVKAEIEPSIRCSTQYGNFFQFGSVIINQIHNTPFIPEEIKFRVSTKIIPNLIKPLYGESPECGLREIIQNASDATKELPNVKLSNNKIKLDIIEKDSVKKIVIRDYGIGMTEEILLNRYFVIGESSKKGNIKNLVGQFGIGALAAFLLGDTIDVKTKHFESDLVYSFSYNLNSNNNAITVAIKEEADFKHGTEVSIDLNSALSNLNQQSLESKLKLNEWYLMPDIAIEYTYDDKIEKIKSLIGIEYQWESISGDSIKYLNKSKEPNKPQIIYNGLMVPEPYKFKSKYLNKQPYVSVSSSSNDISLNLERSKIEKGIELIIEPLEKELIKRGLYILRQEKENIVTANGEILRIDYENEYLKNIPLFFTTEGFNIVTSDILQGDFFVEVYGYYGNPKINLGDLVAGKKYIFRSVELNKVELGELILKSTAISVSNEIIKKYFYDASSFNYGFKTEIMKSLYNKAFSVNYDSELSAQQFWNKHKDLKEKEFQSFFDEPKDICIPQKFDAYPFIKTIKQQTKATTVAYHQYLENIVYDSTFINVIKLSI